jgi:hypothetical protein
MLKTVLEILSTTPQKLEQEISTFSRRELMARPAEGKWSVQEILAHLSDVEELGMRARVAAMVEQKNPTLLPFDQEARAVELEYGTIDAQKSLASLITQRRANIRWLNQLRPAELKREGTHPGVGTISVEELVTEWAFHDLSHLRQILDVKRRFLFPRMGKMRAFYDLK